MVDVVFDSFFFSRLQVLGNVTGIGLIFVPG